MIRVLFNTAAGYTGQSPSTSLRTELRKNRIFFFFFYNFNEADIIEKINRRVGIIF